MLRKFALVTIPFLAIALTLTADLKPADANGFGKHVGRDGFSPYGNRYGHGKTLGHGNGRGYGNRYGYGYGRHSGFGAHKYGYGRVPA